MAQHDRNLLKKSDIQSFMKWLDGSEWRVGKGEYQLMQVKLQKGWGAICIDASGVITTPTEIAPLIKMFKAGKPRITPPPAASLPRTTNQQQFQDELRDDFAIAALQGFLSATGAEDARNEMLVECNKEGVDLPEYIARMSYRMADAMLAERKKTY